MSTASTMPLRASADGVGAPSEAQDASAHSHEWRGDPRQAPFRSHHPVGFGFPGVFPRGSAVNKTASPCPFLHLRYSRSASTPTPCLSLTFLSSRFDCVHSFESSPFISRSFSHIHHGHPETCQWRARRRLRRRRRLASGSHHP